MNHNETEITIIENGWMKLKCTVGDSIALLPSDAILDRLIRFPKTPYHDPYNLEKFRIRPQIFDRESQLLLQERSNSFEILSSRRMCGHNKTWQP